MLLKKSKQYNAGILAAVGLDIRSQIGNNDAYAIFLTNEDINVSDSGYNYVFSAHYENITVISLARTNPLNFGVIPKVIDVPFMFDKMKNRALKLINKSIGYGLYEYEALSNLKSVMYGPVLSLRDLDRVGDWY